MDLMICRFDNLEMNKSLKVKANLHTVIPHVWD